MNILDKITEYKKHEVERLKKTGIVPPEQEPDPKRDFKKAVVEARPVGLIAEAKKASPSKGLLCPDFDPVALAQQYEEGGADAMSVLTDEKFFQGHLGYLFAARQSVSLPVLRKDFIIDHIQVEQAHIYGADAMLLICAILDAGLLKELLQHARELGMDCLVEVHDEHEAEQALDAGADLIGINNRNLKDFTVSLDTSVRVRKVIPSDVPVVSESGIRGFEDVERLAAANIQGILVGESIVRAEDRVQAVRGLKGLS